VSFSSPAGGPIASAFVDISANTTSASLDIDRFIANLRLVDEASARVGEAIENHFQEAARTSERALRDIGGAGTFTPVVAESEVAGEKIERNFDEAARSSHASLARISTGLTLLGGAIAAAGAATVGFGISQAASLEQTQIGFESLLGSAQEADAFIKQMQQFAATTPFEFQGLANNTRQLLAVSASLGLTREQLIPTISTIGDLTAVLGAPPDAIDRVVRALGQMGSKGKITTEELLQLGEALPGFAPFQAMAQGLGITTAELQDQVSKGLIPADQGVRILLDSMAKFPGAAGAMAKQAQTLTGLFSTFKDTVSLALTDAFQPLIPTIKEQLAAALPAVQSALDAIAPALSGIVTGLLPVIQSIIGNIGPALGTALGGIGTGLQAIGPSLGNALATLAPLIAGLAPIFDGLLRAVGPVIEVFAQLIAAVGGPLIQVLGRIVQAVAPLIATLAVQLAPIISDIASIIQETLGPAFDEIIPVIGGAFTTVLQGLVQALEILRPSIDEIVTALGTSLATVLEELAPVLPDLADAFAQLAIAGAELLVALTPLIVGFIQLGTEAFTRVNAPLIRTIADAVSFLAGIFAQFPILLSPALTTFEILKTSITFLWQSVLVPLADFITAVFIPVFKAIELVVLGPLAIAFAFLTEGISALWRTVLEPLSVFLSAVLSPSFDAVTAAVSAVANAIGAVLGPVIRAIKSALGGGGEGLAGILDLAKAAWDRLSGAVSAITGPLTSVKNFIQGVIDKISTLISKIKDLPGAGIVQRGISFLPGFQGGGIITQDTLARLHSPEVVIPLNDPERAAQLASASGLLQQLGGAFGGGTGGSSTSVVPIGAGVNIGSVQVIFQGEVSRAGAEAAAGAFVDGIETTIRRRQLELAVRTVG
jgi:tape measure domain-containing protein